MDRQPVLGAALGGLYRWHHPEHVRADLHCGEHPSIRTDHDQGSTGPDSRRGHRRLGAGSDRHLRHQGVRALRSLCLRCGIGQRATGEIQTRGGVVFRWRHDHPRSGPSQGSRCTAGRAALVPGHAGRHRGFAGPCIRGRRIPDDHRPILERSVRLRHQSGHRRSHLRRSGHHDHVWQPHRFERDPVSAVGKSHGSIASGLHVHDLVQRAGLRGAGPAAVLRDPIRHSLDEGVGPRRRPGPGPATGARLRPALRAPAASHDRRPRVVGLGDRASVAGLAGRRAVTTRVHSRPRLRGRRFVPGARRSGAEAPGEEPVPVLSMRCAGAGASGRCAMPRESCSPTSPNS